ncbi:hypothetical protein [Acinetobacter larvae]|uniref:Uncharacterized protein n=1 Tax=Acinetobacter larvae TaxID=1789224 RepID=A0A1B2LZ64_9GAMM|nr:hypothetical protein [Acinetobacter larvae]AOA58211.1 hypothetical protein BFG52_07510 [Acinetobacter larvae]
MTIVVYSDADIEKVQGITYRKLDDFFGAVSGATAVFIDGDDPEIKQAYESAKIKILDELPTSAQPPNGSSTVNWADIQGKPSFLELGTTATTAAKGDHDHAIKAHTASGLAAATNLQNFAQALSARTKALEDKQTAG